MNKILYLLGTVMGLLPFGSVAESLERPKLKWYMYDLPPYHVMRGEFIGQGPLDLMRDTWVKSLPDIDHQFFPVNISRMSREFKQSKPGLCITGSFIFPESRGNWVWSEAIYIEPPASIVIRSDTWEEIGRPRSVSLESLLEDPTIRFGHFGQRIYGNQIDRLLERFEARPDFITVTTRASGETLMKMLYRHRVDFILEYLPEIKWLVKSKQVESEGQFETVDIEGHQQLSPVHVGCTNTEFGRRVIARLNDVIDESFRLKVWRNHKLWLPSAREGERFLEYQRQYFGADLD